LPRGGIRRDVFRSHPELDGLLPADRCGRDLGLARRRQSLIKGVAVAATVPPLLWAIQLFAQYQRNFAGRSSRTSSSRRGPALDQELQHLVLPGRGRHQHLHGAADGADLQHRGAGLLGINRQVKAYFALFLLLDTGMMGVFCALDFFLFYIFWEVMLLPMYFLIGIWGGRARSTPRSSSSSTRSSAASSCSSP